MKVITSTVNAFLRYTCHVNIYNIRYTHYTHTLHSMQSMITTPLRISYTHMQYTVYSMEGNWTITDSVLVHVRNKVALR